MSGRRRRGDGHPRGAGDRRDDKSFAEHMDDLGDLEPVEPDRRVADSSTPHLETPGSAATGSASDSGASPDSVPVRDPLRTPRPDEPLFAHRSFVRRRVLRDLRAGRIRPQDTIDLHRLDRRRAERRVTDRLVDAKRDGLRCLLVIVGRGRHSEEGAPLLREALPGWLGQARLADVVAAFAPAIPSDGGRGAVYVLLR